MHQRESSRGHVDGQPLKVPTHQEAQEDKCRCIRVRWREWLSLFKRRSTSWVGGSTGGPAPAARAHQRARGPVSLTYRTSGRGGEGWMVREEQWGGAGRACKVQVGNTSWEGGSPAPAARAHQRA